MAVEQTLSIIKPDAVSENHIGDILSIYERAGLLVTNIKMIRLSKEEAEKFMKFIKKDLL